MRFSKLRRLALVGCAIVMSAPPVMADAATSPNLIVNGDAEAHRCTRDWTAETPVPGWRVVRGAASVLCYSAFAFVGETPVTPATPPQGKALFAAPGADTAMEQSVDVGAAREGIDRGAVRFELSGWLGGVDDRPERATLTAVFLDNEGHAAGAPVILAGPDAAARTYTTGLVAEKASGAVPARTRRIVVTVAFVSGMTSFQNAFADNISLTLTGDVGSLAPGALQPPTADIPKLDHMFILMMENTNYADVVSLVGGAPKVTDNMPYLASLAAEGVLMTDSWGTYHPSDQNYVAMVAGDTFRFGPVYYPDFDLPETHIGDLIEAKGKTWRGFVQKMRKPCNLVSQGWFAPDDEPFAQFHDVISNPTRCQASLLDLTAFTAAIGADTLPNFAWLAANGWWDGEGAWEENFDVKFSLVKQDAFLRLALEPLVASSAWSHSRSIVIVTWDETDVGAGPTITFRRSSSVRRGSCARERARRTAGRRAFPVSCGPRLVAFPQPPPALCARPQRWLSPRPPTRPCLRGSSRRAASCRRPRPASPRRSCRAPRRRPRWRPPPPRRPSSPRPRLPIPPPACPSARSSSPCAWKRWP